MAFTIVVSLVIYTRSQLSILRLIACTSNCRGVIKQFQKLQAFVIFLTGNRLPALYSDTDYFTKQVQQWANSDENSELSLLLFIPHEHDRVQRVERLHRILTYIPSKQLAFKDHLSPKYWKFFYQIRC